MGKSLEAFNKQGKIKTFCRKQNERDFRGESPEFGSLCRVRISNPEKKRWTDAWFDLEKQGSNIKACVHHEKGYPSENKGTVKKCAKLNWLSDKVPE